MMSVQNTVGPEWADTEEEYAFELATNETVRDLTRWLTKRANEDKFEHAVFALLQVAYYAMCNICVAGPKDTARMYGVESGDATLSPTAVDVIVGIIAKLRWFDGEDGELKSLTKAQGGE
jgi:hypothetical protein